MTAQLSKMPAPRVVPMPTLGEFEAKAAIEAMTPGAALPSARKATPATLGESFSQSTASVSEAQK